MDSFFAKKYHLSAIFVLIIASAIPYINALSNGFVYDDIPHIVENIQLRDPSNLFRFIQSPRGINKVILLFEYQIWGLNPFVYHLTNLILHVICTLSLYLLFFKVFKSFRIALIAGMLFAVHPIHTEAVTAISNRNELLAMFFFTWSFIFYIEKVKSLWFYLLSVISFFLALLSKEAAVLTLPLMFVLYDIYFTPLNDPLASKGRVVKTSGHWSKANRKKHPNFLARATKYNRWATLKKNARYYVPYWVISIFLISMAFVFRIFPATFDPESSFKQTLPSFYTACRAFLIYLKLHIFPLNLNVDHFLQLSQSIFSLNVLISLVSLIVFLILTVKMYYISKAVSFGMAWFFIALLPLSNLLFPLTPHFVAERYLYVPSAGFCVVMAVVIHKIMGIDKVVFLRLSPEKLGVFLLTVIVGLYSGLTIARNLDWRSEYSLWSKTVEQSPNSFSAHNNLGVEFAERGLYRYAVDEFLKSIELKTDHSLAYNNLGNVYVKMGNIEGAIKEYTKALVIKPEYPEAHYNIALAYESKGLYEQASNHHQQYMNLISNNSR